MVSLAQWLKTTAFAAIFFIVGLAVTFFGLILANTWNQVIGTIILVVGIICLLAAVYFWKNPAGTFR